MKEVHLFIIWENAREKENEILEDIKSNFTILGLYNITWSREKFSQNLSRFYGTNLPKNSGKEQHCGNGTFLLVIVEVENPIYEKRDTSKGMQTVNINMFDKKTYYRELTGGGHKIHATNSEEETNHDLSLLLGKNIADYLKNFDPNQEIQPIEWKKDLIGAEGFQNVEEMFYTLNNCIHYTILRNYETLPEEIYVNHHNDIDILCDNLENAVYILNGEKVFPETYRIHYKVKAGDKFAYFDIRHIGDNYYYYKMEQDLLKNRIYQEKGFYTLNEEDYFYSLLYHALLHKPQFAEDYQKRLQKMKPQKENLETEEDYIKTLNQWLLEKGYSIIKPTDKSVAYQLEKAKKFDSVLLCSNLSEVEEVIREKEILEKEKQNLKNELEKILYSRTWRYTKIIRDLKNRKK